MSFQSDDPGRLVVNDEASAAEVALLDLDALSRQVATFDIKSQIRFAGASILVSGLGALGCEICKNICLSGPRAVTIHDDRQASLDLLASNFFKESEEPSSWRNKTLAEATVGRLAQLNPGVEVRVVSLPRAPSWPRGAALSDQNLELLLAGHDVVVMCDVNEADQISANEFCRSRGIKFISATARGVFAWAFADFGDDFITRDQVE